MEVILKKDVSDLGMEGEKVSVARGYARNYLIPRGMALESTVGNSRIMEQQRKKIDLRRLKARQEAEKLRERISGIGLTFRQKAGDEGKLYGSVTTMDVATELEKLGLTLDRRKIVMERPIKALGDYEIPIKIYPEVSAAIKVTVLPEGEAS